MCCNPSKVKEASVCYSLSDWTCDTKPRLGCTINVYTSHRLNGLWGWGPRWWKLYLQETSLEYIICNFKFESVSVCCSSLSVQFCQSSTINKVWYIIKDQSLIESTSGISIRKCYFKRIRISNTWWVSNHSNEEKVGLNSCISSTNFKCNCRIANVFIVNTGSQGVVCISVGISIISRFSTHSNSWTSCCNYLKIKWYCDLYICTCSYTK